ncbi:MAG TPA: MEDS domain-containing protein [Methylophilaceae bacterium]|nr:MEDS domain-containing protein [Methylophilaceae bacterium]
MHQVQIYQNDETLVEAVCHFASYQLQPTEAVIIVVTDTHLAAIEARLTAQGIDLERAMRNAQYNFIDAELLIASLTGSGEFDFARAESDFRKLLEGLLQAYRHVRVYGETVDLLWQRGEKQNAKALEALWNRLLERYSLSVLCTYRMDNLDPAAYNGDIECLCSTHTHFLPSQDPALLEQALAVASENVMGVSLTGMMKSIAKFPHPTTIMPASQASLLYISKTMPVTTEVILNQVRAHLADQNPPSRRNA